MRSPSRKGSAVTRPPGSHVLAVPGEQRGHPVHGQGAVEGAGQWQPAGVRVREARDRSAGIGGAATGDGVHRARGAETEHRLSRQQPQAECRRHVVPGTGGHQGAGRQETVPGLPDRARRLPPNRVRVAAARGVQAGEFQDLRVVGAGRRGPPAGARGIAPVGARLPGQPLGQEVVRQPHGSRRPCGLRFVLPQPGPLGDGEGRRRDAADPFGPGLGAAEVGDQAVALGRRAYVVPQQCGPHRISRAVQRHQAVLLACDGHGGGLAGGPPALPHRGAQRLPPLLGVRLAPVARGDGVRCLSSGDHLAGRGVHHECLGGLGRAVDPDDERAFRCAHGLPLPSLASGAVRILICKQT